MNNEELQSRATEAYATLPCILLIVLFYITVTLLL